MAGIYIHIPFCKQRCRYCAFYSSTLFNIQRQYVSALCGELAMRRSYINEAVNTIYLGGGTPSTLSVEELRIIFDTIERNYHIAPNPEITIECNPDDLTPWYLESLGQLPINRISMGVQSFNDRQLEKLGRRHNADKAREAVRNARATGFRNISIDLMFALPDSTADDWRHDLECAIELQPEHISAYNLTYEDGTPLHRSVQQGETVPLSEEANIEQFQLLIETLTRAGYRHYEISNFARPGRESRHNSSYWNDTPYLGCGAAAHSYNGTSRQWNIADAKEYIKGIEGNAPLFEIEYLSEAERYNDTILTRLRTADGLPIEWLSTKFHKKLLDHMLQNAEPHIARGNLKKEHGRISLTTKGIFISDSIMRDLIYLE